MLTETVPQGSVLLKDHKEIWSLGVKHLLNPDEIAITLANSLLPEEDRTSTFYQGFVSAICWCISLVEDCPLEQTIPLLEKMVNSVPLSTQEGWMAAAHCLGDWYKRFESEPLYLLSFLAGRAAELYMLEGKAQ